MLDLQFVLVNLVLMLLGSIAGAAINYGIYRCGFNKRLISPWSSVPEACVPRNWLDRIPIFGWLRLRRESHIFGRAFWIRPMLIEMVSALALAWIYHLYMNGLLIGGTERVTRPEQQVVSMWLWTWFIFHSVVMLLLAIATFIDFDEQTIPDWVTIPGTLFSLAVAASFPASRLPVVDTGIAGREITALHFNSPLPLTDWHHSINGLAVALTIATIWCVALLPTFNTLRWGLLAAVKFYFATLFPRPRRKPNPLRVRERGLTVYHRMIGVVWIFLLAGLVLVWGLGEARWDALFSSILGLAFGAGLTWVVRIIAGQALGVEAMGFGDVTLMGMIGAALGWQSALLVFAFAPFASILVALAILISTGEQRIAFGPYLCIAAVFVLFSWHSLWHDWAADGIFSLGSVLLIIVGGALFLMGVLLFVWGSIKARLFRDAA
ncbi:MAG TPA: A24 family peptidase [Pirellulaceae bacterium]|nr:A24 family peptidase [Pirellulaceae bacterium]HMO93758.1 A24 family peptidase [Pirellulaceae bacterium]HMP71471.1 A24 family peptidase [Pirellulaceae bacterium]